MGNLPRPAAWLAALTAVLLAVVGPAHGLTQTNAALNPQPVQGLNVEGASKPTSLVIDNSGNLGAVEAGNPPTQAWTTAPIVATVYTQPKVAKAEMVGGNIDFTVVDVDITTGTIYRYTGTATISGNTLTVLTGLPITPISYPGVPTAITTLTDFHPLEVGGNAYIAVTGTDAALNPVVEIWTAPTTSVITVIPPNPTVPVTMAGTISGVKLTKIDATHLLLAILGTNAYAVLDITNPSSPSLTVVRTLAPPAGFTNVVIDDADGPYIVAHDSANPASAVVFKIAADGSVTDSLTFSVTAGNQPATISMYYGGSPMYLLVTDTSGECYLVKDGSLSVVPLLRTLSVGATPIFATKQFVFVGSGGMAYNVYWVLPTIRTHRQMIPIPPGWMGMAPNVVVLEVPEVSGEDNIGIDEEVPEFYGFQLKTPTVPAQVTYSSGQIVAQATGGVSSDMVSEVYPTAYGIVLNINPAWPNAIPALVIDIANTDCYLAVVVHNVTIDLSAETISVTPESPTYKIVGAITVKASWEDLFGMAHQKTLDLTGRLSATNPDGTPVGGITYDPVTGLVTIIGAKEPKVLVKIDLSDYLEGLRTVALGTDVPPVTSLEQRVANLEHAVSTLSAQIGPMSSEIANIKSDISNINAEIQEIKNAMKKGVPVSPVVVLAGLLAALAVLRRR
ncbi:hypothetical protein [Methanopyrus kandleri]